DREYRNPGDRLRVLDGEAFGTRNRADAGSEGVTGIVGVHDAAALHAVSRPQSAGWIIGAVEKSVLARIGVDDATDRTVFGCDLGLDTSPAGAVTGDDDCAFHRNPEAIEFVIVLAVAEIYVDERASDVSIGGIGVVRRELFRSLVRRRIDGERRLL